MKTYCNRSQAGRLFLAMALFMLGIPFSGSAANYYMATNGANTNNGSKTAPWKTLLASSGKLHAGDTLFIRGGTYSDKGIRWTATIGTTSNPVIVKNYPGEVPLFEGANTTSGCLGAFESKYTIWDGLSFQNYQAVSTGVIWLGYSGSGTNYSVGNTIRNCTFKNIGNTSAGSHRNHAVYISYGTMDITVNNNTFIGVSGGAIHTYHGPGLQRGKFYNNKIFKAAWGVILADGARDVQIYNNLIVNCGSPSNGGVELNYSGQGEVSTMHGNINTIVRNNMFYGNFLALNTGSQTQNATISNNLFFNNTNIGTQGSLPVLSNPLLVNFKIDGSGDYHLTTGSSAINAGYATGAPSVDFDGVLRQGAPDIGVYEYRTGSSVAIANPTVEPGLLAAQPNPFTSYLNIRLTGGMNQESSVLTIYDVRGKVVHRAEFTGNRVAWNPAGLPIGAYLIRVKTAQGKQYETRNFLMK